ncbi:ABC transporter ATP-binding protein [Streptomyces sp. 1331.2]|uniref:ABC transporter ATP-binding protein n=1 Tax=Streptomyces sp. 1331.2 TaxID=1938835 RepID=UPI000BDD7D03|nr:ABC transporter ATP-binding protein [Streptomyces sp. 1331.2]SOB80371.1 ABC-type multidrug transport system, ATPase and permease component [Streptomyces sp. 1331.2]
MKPPVHEEQGPTATLPVGSPAAVRGYLLLLARRHRAGFSVVVALHSLSTLAGLVGPWVLGSLVESLATGTAGATITVAVAWYLLALVAQAAFTGWSRMRGAVLGERVLADLREDFLVRSVALPTGVLERAGTGDLVSRGTTDVDRLDKSVREAVPELAVAVVSLLLVLGALLVTSPLLALTSLVGLPLLLASSRWYFRRAPQSYRNESAGYAAVNTVLAETVDAGRTVEALRLGDQRIRLTDRKLREWLAWERYTLWLRSVWFPTIDAVYTAAVLATLVLGGLFTLRGWITVGQLTTGVLYAQMLTGPVDMILRWYDELQIGQASLARLVGVREVPEHEGDESARPDGRRVEARDVRFGYREGADVLHGISLDVAPGSRVALVGPSGAGKSTLGRLLAGIYAPGRGSVTLGGAALSRMPAERVRAEVALVNQEHHVFVGTLRDNLRLAAPEADDTELRAALDAVDAGAWVDALPEGLDTEVGSGGASLTPPQAQQLALARLVLADPHTLVLDEATSLLDPRAARHLERSLSRVLEGRTVIAIAHRLHTAHDADVIAVVEGGRISEYGSHPELVAAGGPYAALWRSWRDER